MGILDRARADARRILSDLNGFATALHFRNPANEQEAFLNGTFFRRTVMINEGDGNPVNTRRAHITFAEIELAADYYSVRDAQGKVHMAGHLVSCADASGIETTFVVAEWMPDETLGTITCMLGAYEA